MLSLPVKFRRRHARPTCLRSTLECIARGDLIRFENLAYWCKHPSFCSSSARKTRAIREEMRRTAPCPLHVFSYVVLVFMNAARTGRWRPHSVKAIFFFHLFTHQPLAGRGVIHITFTLSLHAMRKTSR